MTKYLISFPGETFHVAAEDMAAVSADSHAATAEAKAAGVYVFGGGINEEVDPVLVDQDGVIGHSATHLTGGYLVLELPTRDDAITWAARFAAACRTPQEVREFGYDPES